MNSLTELYRLLNETLRHLFKSCTLEVAQVSVAEWYCSSFELLFGHFNANLKASFKQAFQLQLGLLPLTSIVIGGRK